jgi:inorganic pyrophosphatase
LPSPETLPPYHPETESLLAIIETVRGSRTKVKFDADLNTYLLGTILPAGTSFPYDFGFIPQTKAEDGDPLDVLVFMEEPVFVGCAVEIRLIGVMEAEQTEEGETFRNDRLIAVALKSKEYADYRELSELPGPVREQIEQFFTTYNTLRGHGFKILGMHGAKQAEAALRKALPRRARRRTS